MYRSKGSLPSVLHTGSPRVLPIPSKKETFHDTRWTCTWTRRGTRSALSCSRTVHRCWRVVRGLNRLVRHKELGRLLRRVLTQVRHGSLGRRRLPVLVFKRIHDWFVNTITGYEACILPYRPPLCSMNWPNRHDRRLPEIRRNHKISNAVLWRTVQSVDYRQQ